MIWWIVLLLEFIFIFASSQKLIVSLGFILYRVFRSSKVVVSLLALLFFPGVVIHELSHLLMAGVLFVRVHNIEFLPEIRGSSVKLGSVQVSESDFVRQFLIGVAPFIFGNIVMLLLIFYLGQGFSLEGIWKYMILIYSVFVISNTMFSSKKDLEGAVEFLLLALVLGIALFILNKQIYINGLSYISQESVVVFIRPIVYLLLIPLGINLFFLSVFQFLLKRN